MATEIEKLRDENTRLRGAINTAISDVAHIEGAAARVLAGDKEKRMLVAGATYTVERAQAARSRLVAAVSP